MPLNPEISVVTKKTSLWKRREALQKTTTHKKADLCTQSQWIHPYNSLAPKAQTTLWKRSGKAVRARGPGAFLRSCLLAISEVTPNRSPTWLSKSQLNKDDMNMTTNMINSVEKILWKLKFIQKTTGNWSGNRRGGPSKKRTHQLVV